MPFSSHSVQYLNPNNFQPDTFLTTQKSITDNISMKKFIENELYTNIGNIMYIPNVNALKNKCSIT